MKVSICIPSYNNPIEVKRLLDSIEVQDFDDYEICISDDSLNDQVEKVVCENDKKTGKRIRYIHNKKPLGHVYNWNAALSMAEGEYIKIMFSDDYFSFPDSLSKLCRLLDENPDCDLAFSNSLQVPEDTKKEAYVRRLDEDYIERLKKDYRYVFISNQIGAPSDVIIRNKEKTLYRFDEESNWASDVFWYLRILSNNPHFAATNEPLISIGMHEEQYTHSFEEYDRRKLMDYRGMYIKFGLGNSRECREFYREYALRNRKERFKRKLKALLGREGRLKG